MFATLTHCLTIIILSCIESIHNFGNLQTMRPSEAKLKFGKNYPKFSIFLVNKVGFYLHHMAFPQLLYEGHNIWDLFELNLSNIQNFIF